MGFVPPARSIPPPLSPRVIVPPHDPEEYVSWYIVFPFLCSERDGILLEIPMEGRFNNQRMIFNDSLTQHDPYTYTTIVVGGEEDIGPNYLRYLGGEPNMAHPGKLPFTVGFLIPPFFTLDVTEGIYAPLG